MTDLNETYIKAISFVALIIAIMIHEISHGLAALACGDPTARDAGRISLNPIRHVDPIGSIVLPFILVMSGAPFLFGWAKPVPINLMRTRNPRQALWMTAIAGPLSNLLQALLAAAAFYGLATVANRSEPNLFIEYAAVGCLMFAIVNIVLMTFNLIPIPPLDGSRVVAALLPEKFAIPYMRLERYGFLIIIVLINLPLLEKYNLPFLRYINLSFIQDLLQGVISWFFRLAGIF